jgi:hypothetical protein
MLIFLWMTDDQPRITLILPPNPNQIIVTLALVTKRRARQVLDNGGSTQNEIRHAVLNWSIAALCSLV